MKFRPLRNIIPLFLVLTLLLGSFGCGGGYVWCFAEDGQARLETAAGNGCNRTAPSDCVEDLHHPNATTNAAPILAAIDDCGPCLDLAIAPDSFQHRPQSGFSLAAPALPPLASDPIAFFPPVEAPTALLIPEPPPRIDTNLLILRTIVLLI